MSDAPTDPTERARQVYLRATEPGAEVTARLECRLRSALRDDPDVRQAALLATSASPATLVRLRSRLRRSRRPAPSWRWVAGGALITAGVAASLALAIGHWRGGTPDAVALQLDGEGVVGGTRSAPEIAWVEGTLAVEVTPNRGVHLGVSTPEARVEVVGTRFTVDRRLHATEIAVTEGKVRVVCAGLPEVFVTAGQRRRCLPTDPGALLSRAVELDQAGAPADERLETATRAVQVAQHPAAEAELRVHRLSALAELGRTAEALADARVYLATGEAARRAEVTAFVAQTRFEAEGCAAEPDLEAAVAEAPAGPEALLLATCLADRDPARARALVQAAGPRAAGAWRDLADQLADRLAVRW